MCLADERRDKVGFFRERVSAGDAGSGETTWREGSAIVQAISGKGRRIDTIHEAHCSF